MAWKRGRSDREGGGRGPAVRNGWQKRALHAKISWPSSCLPLSAFRSTEKIKEDREKQVFVCIKIVSGGNFGEVSF